jgi:long-subunit acyl-CoA synthetase (AMP-forming)
MTSSVDQPNDGISIGKPIANTQVYVLDKFRKPLPAGIPGELFIAGDGVARGYLNRPELTEERFTSDPFSSLDGARMYATGDLATYREDGALMYLGRTDFQVKLRGYRIELGEIESRLEAIPEVAEAAVIVRSADEGDQRMVAYITSDRSAAPDAAELRVVLRQSLPDYMIPNEFVTLEFMPRTANGKLDRKELAQIKPVIANRVTDDAAPTNDIEKTLVRLWQDVLKLDAVGMNENFFDIGGHSLLVVQLHTKIKEAIEQPVSLTDLYANTTISSLAAFLIGGADNRSVKQSVSRGEQRRALRRRRAS